MHGAQVNVVKARGERVGGVADTVVIAKVLFDRCEDLLERTAAAGVEKGAAGRDGKLLHDPPAAKALDAAPAGDLVEVRIQEENAVNGRSRALGRFDRLGRAGTASGVHAVAEQDQGLAALLF